MGSIPRGLGYYKMPARDFAQAATGTTGSHTPQDGNYDLNRFATASDADLYRYVDRCIEGAELLGQSYITWPFLEEPLRQLEPFNRIIGRFNGIGERIAKGGLQFAYHNPASSSPSRTVASPTTSSCARPIPSWSSSSSISTGCHTTRSSRPATGSNAHPAAT